MSSSDPPFQHIAIVGLGLIGGSIALAVREHWPASRVVGVDGPAVLAHALGSGAIERGAEDIASLSGVDLVILAAPVRQNVGLLARLSSLAPVVVTDVSGTKREIVRTARALPASVSFVGGHPLSGGERGGFAFARGDLFAGRPWIFTPDGDRGAEGVARLSRFVEGFGARVTVMDAAEHDRLMAFLSHLPQLTASALMEVAGRAAGADGLRLAGRGLVDTTRLASSPANVWRDICLTNADALGEALDLLIERLTRMRADLSRDGAIDSTFDEAARWRAELLRGRE